MTRKLRLKLKAKTIKASLVLIPILSSLYASYQGKDNDSIIFILCVFAYILFSVFFPFIDKKAMQLSVSYIAFDESEENHVIRFTAMVVAATAYLLLLIFGLIT